MGLKEEAENILESLRSRNKLSWDEIAKLREENERIKKLERDRIREDTLRQQVKLIKQNFRALVLDNARQGHESFELPIEIDESDCTWKWTSDFYGYATKVHRASLIDLQTYIARERFRSTLWCQLTRSTGNQGFHNSNDSWERLYGMRAHLK